MVQQKKYEKEQEDIKHIKAFIASCGGWGSRGMQYAWQGDGLDGRHELKAKG